MNGRTALYRRILITASIVFLALPVLSKAHESGHDWYCPDPDAHAQYEKHRKLHHDHETEVVTTMLQKLYADQRLSPEEKNAKAMELLTKYTEKVKMGLGD